MPNILNIWNWQWREALAGEAYAVLSREKPQYLDKYEEVRDTSAFNSLISQLNELDDSYNWDESMKLLSRRVAVEYVTERVTGRTKFPGSMMTLIGHAGDEMIEMGFLGSLAHRLDEGETERLFKQYLTIDLAFQASFHSGDIENGRKLAEGWRLVQIALRDSYESLLERVESET